MTDYTPGTELDWIVAQQVMGFNPRFNAGPKHYVQEHPVTKRVLVHERIPNYSTVLWQAEQVVEVIQQCYGTDLGDLDDPFVICTTALLISNLVS